MNIFWAGHGLDIHSYTGANGWHIWHTTSERKRFTQQTEPPFRISHLTPDVKANSRSHGRGPEQAQLLDSRERMMSVMRAFWWWAQTNGLLQTPAPSGVFKRPSGCARVPGHTATPSILLPTDLSQGSQRGRCRKLYQTYSGRKWIFKRSMERRRGVRRGETRVKGKTFWPWEVTERTAGV